MEKHGLGKWRREERRRTGLQRGGIHRYRKKNNKKRGGPNKAQYTGPKRGTGGGGKTKKEADGGVRKKTERDCERKIKLVNLHEREGEEKKNRMF